MADYNQNIKVNADTKSAERELSKLDKILKGLSTYVIDPGKGAAQAGVKLAQRNLQDYGRTLGAIDRQLGGFGKRLGDIAKAFDFAGKTAVGVAGLNALGSALAALPARAGGALGVFRTFGAEISALTGPAAKVAAAIGAMGPQGLAAAGGIAAATAAFMAFSPAVKKVVTGLDNLVLGGKIQSAFGGMKGKVEETRQSFFGLNTTIETTVKTLNELAEGMSLRQLNSQVSSLTKEMESFHSSTQQAWDAAQGLVRAQKAQVVEQRALNDLVRQAKGLQPQDVRDAQVSRRKNDVQSGRFQQSAAKEAAADAKRLADELWDANKAWYAFEDAGKKAFAKQEAERLRKEVEALAEQMRKVALASKDVGIRKTEASAAVKERKELERTVALMRERNALLQGNANQYAGMAGPGNDTRANQPQYRQMLNEQVLTARNLGKERRTAMELANRELQFEMRLEKIMERRAALTKQANQDKGRDRNGLGAKLEGVAIGGAFPLLFGAGPGAVVGGALGGLNTQNPIFSVFTSAIGQMLDQFAAAAQDTGRALRDPITNFQKIADAGLLASKSQEFYISKLIEVGRITEATAIIQGEMVKKIGVGGTNDLTRLGETSDRLAKVWAELNLQLQAALAGPLAGLLEWVAAIVALGNQRRSDVAKFKDVRNGLTGKDRQEFDRRSAAITGLTQRGLAFGGITGAEEQKRQLALAQEYAGRSKPQQLRPSATDPKALEAARQAAQQQADLIQSAYREAFSLQRRGIDLQREMTDYRRKAESDIFAKQQEAARLEIDNARKSAQLNIEQTDLALRKQFSGSQGITAELLNGVRAYIVARRSGEADIEQKRRQLEVNLADITKATADYAYEQANRRMQLERSIEDYKRDIADYQLKVARQIVDLTPTTGGGAGGGGSTIAGIADSSLNSNAKAWLSVIRSAEGTAGPNGYRTMFGGGLFNDMSRHPDRVVRSGGYASAAAGAYQFMPGTWQSVGGGAMTPARQDRAAMALASRRGVDLSTAPFTPQNVARLAPEWASLPTMAGRSYYGQPNKSFSNLQRVFAAGGGGSAGQLATAAGSIAAPTYQAPSGNTAGFAGAQGRLAQATKKSVELEREHTRLKEAAAAFDVQELARGQSQVQQTQRQLDLEKGKLTILTSTGGISENEVALLNQQLEGESKIAEIVTAQKATLLEINTAVKEGLLKQTEADALIKQINTGVDKRLEATRTQIGLEQQLLKVQQAQQLALEAQTMQRQLATTGKGIMAGFTGGASGKYDEILGKTGDTKLAGQFAQAQGVLDQLQTAQADASALGGSIAGGFKEAIKAAVTGGDIGAAFSSLFGSLGEKFLEMAFRPIEESLTQAIFGMLAPSNTQVQAAQTMLIAAQQQLQAATMMAGSGGGGGGGLGGIIGSLFGGGGGGLWGAASKVAFNPMSFTSGLSFFADGGYVTGPTPAVVGEGGESEYIIPASKMGAAMGRYSAGARGGGVIPGSSGGGGEGGGGGSIDISYSVTEINSVRYVSEAEFRAGMRQAAEQGAAGGHSRVFGDLRNSRSQRARIGMR